MKPKHQTINELIKANDYKNYFEIGYARGHNFHAIDCENKLAIDINTPTSMDVLEMSSDEFFEKNTIKFDIIFIDGDHDANQVEKDIFNAWYSLKKGGMIVLHDVKPFTKAMQEMPRKQEQWTGDVWRAFKGFKDTYTKIQAEYIDEKYGLGIIYKSNAKIELGFVDWETKYESFIKKIIYEIHTI